MTETPLSDKDIGQSETIAINPPKTKDSSQSNSNPVAEHPPIYRYRPNNAVLRVKILEWASDFHLPVIKKTGKNTIKEYLYWKNATFERAKNSKWLFIYPKKRFVRRLEQKEDVDKANREYKEYAIELMRLFVERYPQVKLDEMNGVLNIREFEVKDSTLKMPRNLRFKDTIGKKVYQNGIEFYSPIYVKNFIKNRAVENWSPELMKEIEQMRTGFWDELNMLHKEIEQHRALIKDYREESRLNREFMEKQLKSESIFRKIFKLFQNFHKKSRRV